MENEAGPESHTEIWVSNLAPKSHFACVDLVDEKWKMSYDVRTFFMRKNRCRRGMDGPRH